jgi:hypothetical protein
MALMPLVIAGGMAKGYLEDVAEKKAKLAQIEAVKTEWLFKTGMSNIQNRREQRKAAQARVSEAKRFGFSHKSAMALEMSGQLEFELGKVKSLIEKNKLSENYIPTLVAYLEGKVDNDVDLAESISRGLQSDSLLTEEEQSLGLINSLGDLTKLQEEFLKTTTGGRTSIPAFQYTPTKGARIELSDIKSIRSQLASTLNTIYANSFQINQMGDVSFTQNAKPEVQQLFNTLADKTKMLAEDPTNSYSPTSALNTVINTIQTSQFVPPNVVIEKIDEAITTPNFNWDPFRTNTSPTNPTTNNPPSNNNNPVND